MSKLEEIIDAATSDDVPIASLLRMLKVVASRTKVVLLGDWVANELAGYPQDAPLPDYRGPFPAEVVSEWSGPYRSTQPKVPLPPSWAPEGLREAGAFTLQFRQPVRELELLAARETALASPWGADLIAQLNGEIQRGAIHAIVPMHLLVTAHQQVTPAHVGSVLDNVRTRVLEFALEAEQLVPDAGEPGVVPVDQGQINYMVINNIYGSANAVSIGPDVIQLISSVQTGDRESLKRAVEAAGLPADQIFELEAAIDADNTEGQQGLGSRVKGFLGKLALGTGKETGKAAITAAGGVIVDLVRRYYGLQ
ncbi:AbiTii domain-containing protein [Mycolicibacterium mengxianglii]|uniref:AbiTii domain-containing protein n=1 Tax=Mycolicibacterium mengxianglii TaxID=2736649 RepID=UPI0018D1B42E|nr:hypothetical protein [Mycolicibacterium mengxianglii]